MSKTPDRPYAEPPAAPSTRISEARLLEIENNPDRADVYELGEEIRRYRAMLIGLAGPPGSEPYCCACIFCNNSDPGKHNEGCLWPALEAEVEAIREERAEKSRAG